MHMLAPQRGHRQVDNWEIAMRGSGRGWAAQLNRDFTGCSESRFRP